MKYFDHNYYTDVKVKPYRINPTEKKELGPLEEPISLMIQYPFQNDTRIRKKSKSF